MNDLAQHLYETALAMNRAAAEQINATICTKCNEPWHDNGHVCFAQRVAKLTAALRPFVQAYVNARCEISDSDLDNEQPVHVTVTLGDCRKADAALGYLSKEAK